MNTYLIIGAYQLILSGIFFICKSDPTLEGLFVASLIILIVGVLIELYANCTKDVMEEGK